MGARHSKLLIVDDEVDNCENLSDILSDVGYDVDFAHDGPSALRLVEQNAYDVALLDLRMPGMDGLELYQRIKRVAAGTLAIVVSAYAGSETARSILNAGAWKIIPKPVDIEKLVALIEEVTSRPLILLVDDDADFCDNLWEMLRTQGYRVHLAYDAEDASKAVQKYMFRVVLLDMKLRGRCGDEIVASMRQANHETRIVIVTGFADEMKSRIEAALAAGAERVLHKPVEPKSLLATVKELAECP
jgi:CheY-like chemotaxis protein